MKKLILGLFMLSGVLSALPSFADGYTPQAGYKYKVVYAQWDAGFAGYYNYTETCSRTYTGYGVFKTCYDSDYFAPSSYVYVEELQMSGGYHRIDVYRDEAETQLYVTYYIYEDGNTRRVDRRVFYNDPVFVAPYQSTYYVQEAVVWNQLDWTKGFDEVMVGDMSVVIGADVLAHSHGNADAAAIGLASMALGSSSVAAGMEKMRESELETYVGEVNYSSGMDVQ